MLTAPTPETALFDARGAEGSSVISSDIAAR